MLALLNDVNNSDLVLESNLTTMLHSICDTKQYWFMRKSALDCMVCLTFFCTFSCAEYESPDIIEYLRKVKNVPDLYDNGRLCTEDSISISRQFSHKFHQFINIVINKGGVLGPIKTLLLQEGISAMRSTALPCPPLDTGCSHHWKR